MTTTPDEPAPQDGHDTLRAAFQSCFNSRDGQIALEYLMESNWVGIGIPPGDAIERAECEGSRKTVLEILSLLKPRGNHPGIQPDIMHGDTARMIGLVPDR